MNRNDFILLAVVFGSMTAAVCAPEYAAHFQPYLVYYMMSLLFISFLGLDFSAFVNVCPKDVFRLGGLALVKLILLPTALYFAASVFIPEFAVPVLLLSGISTGVVAPFVGMLLGADLAPILRMVVVTSLVVPFSLPALTKMLVGAQVEAPLDQMISLLAVVIFVPMAANRICNRYFPGFLTRLASRRFPVSLVFFTCINFAVFSKYSHFFRQDIGEIAASVALAYVLSVIYYLVGALCAVGGTAPERLAAAASIAAMNNVLVIVFSSQFFGPLCPTLAAMYMFPFFTMIVPAKMAVNYLANRRPRLKDADAV
jgi:BASS family bile acid:Na+ symporter